MMNEATARAGFGFCLESLFRPPGRKTGCPGSRYFGKKVPEPYVAGGRRGKLYGASRMVRWS